MVLPLETGTTPTGVQNRVGEHGVSQCCWTRCFHGAWRIAPGEILTGVFRLIGLPCGLAACQKGPKPSEGPHTGKYFQKLCERTADNIVVGLVGKREVAAPADGDGRLPPPPLHLLPHPDHHLPQHQRVVWCKTDLSSGSCNASDLQHHHTLLWVDCFWSSGSPSKRTDGVWPGCVLSCGAPALLSGNSWTSNSPKSTHCVVVQLTQFQLTL